MANDSIEAQVRTLGTQWAEAERAGDVKSLGDLLTTDFRGVGPRGFVLDKDQWLARYSSGALSNESFTWEEVEVRGYGDAAVAIGLQSQHSTYQGRSMPGRFRVSQFLVRRDGGWAIAGIHISETVPPPPR
jgi:ketosteroid isomerase-like protein